MKMFTLIVILMLTPFASYAERNEHFKHRSHEQQQNDNLYFWQKVDQRQYNQDYRIERGIQTGQLTRREARKLFREQKRAARQIRYYKRYNFLNYRDKREVMECLDYVSDKIRDLKHNQYYAYRDEYKHKKHYKQRYSNNRNYGDERYLSWVDRDVSAGIYFRF